MPSRRFIRREDAERFVDEVRGDDPKLAAHFRIEKREFDADGAELSTEISQRICAYATPTLLSISADTSANCTRGSTPYSSMICAFSSGVKNARAADSESHT